MQKKPAAFKWICITFARFLAHRKKKVFSTFCFIKSDPALAVFFRGVPQWALKFEMPQQDQKDGVFG